MASSVGVVRVSATVARNWALRLSILLAFLLIVLTVDSQSDLQVGYATLVTEGEGDLPVASALFSFRNGEGILVAEAGVEAVAPIRRGRLFVDGSIPTGLALASPYRLGDSCSHTARCLGEHCRRERIDPPGTPAHSKIRD